MRFLLTLTLVLSLLPCPVLGQDAANTAPASPKKGWGDFQVVEQREQTVLTKVLLWVPNRVLDFIDIFRTDVGVGISYGAAIRISEGGQIGYRKMAPGSLRIGIAGRSSPVFIEDTTESGAGSSFRNSPERNICPGIVAGAADLVLVGAQLGICVDEVFDFLGGIVFLDPKRDDY